MANPFSATTAPVFGPSGTVPVYGPRNTVPGPDTSIPHPAVDPAEWSTAPARLHPSVWQTPHAAIGPAAWSTPAPGIHPSVWNAPRPEGEAAPGFDDGGSGSDATTLINRIRGFASNPQGYTRNLVKQGAGGAPVTLLDHIQAFASDPQAMLRNGVYSGAGGE